MTAALSFHDATLGYERRPAVRCLSGEVARGDLLAVVGPNGAGKSTLLKGVAGALRPMSGRIELHGLERRRIAWLPQRASLDLSFPLTVFDFVAMGRWCLCGAFGGLDAAGRERVARSLERVGLAGLEDRPVGALSRGQFQRVLFARLMLQDAPAILLDEPFTAVDRRTEADLIAILRQWRGEGRTVVAVLHDLDHVRAVFPRTLLLARDPVAWGATRDVLTRDNLTAARALGEVWNDDDARRAPVGLAA